MKKIVRKSAASVMFRKTFKKKRSENYLFQPLNETAVHYLLDEVVCFSGKEHHKHIMYKNISSQCRHELDKKEMSTL